MYIDGRPKEIGNIVGFINSTRPSSTSKQPNCIFEVCEWNEVFVCAIKINKCRGRTANRLPFKSHRYRRSYYHEGGKYYIPFY